MICGNRRKRGRARINIKIHIDKRIIITIVAISAILLLSTIFALTNSISERMLSGISISGIDVSNLTINEAYEKISNEINKNIEKNIVLKKDEYETTISLQQLEVKVDVIDAVNEAYKIGRDKNILINNFEIIKTKLFHKNLEAKIEKNDEELNKMLEDISVKVPNLMVDSSYYIDGENLIILSGKEGVVVQQDILKEEVNDAIEKQVKGINIATIEIPTKNNKPKSIDIAKIKEEIYQEPKNAYYEENPFKLYKEVNGVDLKISLEEANNILQEPKEEYIIPLNITPPEVTTNDLTYENFFPEQLAKFQTRYDESNLNRSTNIKLASEKINGQILMPGETFSYNKIVGERTIKTGYKEASVYMNGKVVDGIGGGICQVSSTLYNAVLQANLEIVSRKNHYFITSYVSPSRDATVAYGTIDFQFKNSRTYPVKIECTSQNGVCQVQIYGIKEDEEYDVIIEDKVTEVIPYTTRYIETNKLTKGTENEIQKGVNGYKSEAYRTLILNGQVVSKTLLSKDTYNPLERIVEKGTK